MLKRRLALLLSLIAIASLAVSLSLRYYTLSVRNSVNIEGSVYLPSGSTFASLIDSLSVDGGRLKSISEFKSASKRQKLKGDIKSGHYVLKKGMSYKAVARMFKVGQQSPVRLTFNNIRSMPQLAGRVSTQIDVDSLTLIQSFSRDTIARHYGFSDQQFIAMFIPNSYEVYWTISADGFMDRMKREYDAFWNEERLAKLSATGLSPVEAITLASIVYEETKMSDEMPTVAGVYINRLNKGMKLQADPTVKFAVGDFTLRRILYVHLEVNSPYNTYLYEGLPPGPICMPSVTAIEAVLNYQRHNYIFFCAKEDFSNYHNFAVTLAEHNRNKERWVRALNRAGIR